MYNFISFLTVYDYINVLALIIGIYNLIKGKKSIKYFIGFLSFVVIVEIFGIYYFSKKYGTSVSIISYFSFICSLYYVFIFYSYFQDKLWSKYLKYLIIVWLISSCLIFIFSDIKLEVKPYYLGMALSTFLVLAYFYHLTYKEKFRSIKSEAIFYLGIGILLFVFSTFPILVLLDTVIMNLEYSDIYLKLLQYGNVFLSMSYLAVVLCMKS